MIAADALRFRVTGWGLGVRVPWWAALDATVANTFFAWITPGSAMAEPAAIYMLGRRGVPWDAAALIAFGKSTTSVCVLLGATFLCLALGLGPEMPLYLYAPFVSGTGAVAAAVGLLLVGALAPDATVAWIERRRDRLAGRRFFQAGRARRALDALAEHAGRAVRRLEHFERGGWRFAAALAGSHLLYYGAFVGVFAALAASLAGVSSGAWIAAGPRAIVYIGFTYVAPTPGGAGLSEATAQAFFEAPLGAADAVLAVLAFRALTFYLHVALGFIYLPIAGGAREIVSGRGGNPNQIS